MPRDRIPLLISPDTLQPRRSSPRREKRKEISTQRSQIYLYVSICKEYAIYISYTHCTRPCSRSQRFRISARRHALRNGGKPAFDSLAEARSIFLPPILAFSLRPRVTDATRRVSTTRCGIDTRHFSRRSTATVTRVNVIDHLSSPFRHCRPVFVSPPRPRTHRRGLPFLSSPLPQRHVMGHRRTYTRSAGHAARIYLPPISWVHRRSLSWDTRSRVTI